MRIRGDIVPGTDSGVGEITAAATGHQYFLAGPVGVIEDQHFTPAFAGLDGAHQTGSAGTDDNDIIVAGHNYKT